MNKLTKDQLARKEALSRALSDAHADLEAAVNDFNTKLSAAWTEVEAAVSDYNAQVDEANAFMDEVASDIQSYIDDKSDAWQDGDRGQAYGDWRDEWQDELEHADVEQPEELEVPDNASELFDPKPEEVVA